MFAGFTGVVPNVKFSLKRNDCFIVGAAFVLWVPGGEKVHGHKNNKAKHVGCEPAEQDH
jgi:hypothetical protein